MLKILTIWLANIAVKIILFFAFLLLVLKVKADEGQKTAFLVHHFTLYETGSKTDAYMPEFIPNPKPYKPGRKSSLSNKQLAPAYRMRQTPHYALKTNALFDLTTSLNLGLELRLQRQITLDLPFTLNPWTYNKLENTKFKFLLFQPGLRYWDCEVFNGHFFGVHGHYAYFNVGHLPTPPFSDTMNRHRFEGELLGAGISYGYHWLISPRWSFEAEIGLGYARLWYGKYPCQTCAKLISNEKKHYLGVTRAGLNFIYLF